MAKKIATQSITTEGTGLADFSLNIRNLNSEDVAHIPLPYDDKSMSEAAISITVDNVGGFTFDATDWGTGKDFYLDLVNIMVVGDANFNNAAGNGFFVSIAELGTGGVNTNIITETFAYPNYVPVHYGDYEIHVIMKLPLTKISSTSTLSISVSNASGNTISASLNVHGIAITA